jgi:hypothetical protein
MMNLIQKKGQIIFKIFLFLVALLFIILSSSYAMFSHDDPTNMVIFRNISTQNGLLHSLWLLFTNFDFRGAEYRPFWFSRTLHFFLFQLFKFNPTPYVIITSILHFLSALLIYKIILVLSKNREISFFSALTWLFTPFSAPLFVFHHFCYQALPIYFFLLYCFLIIRKNSSPPFILYLIIFCMVFSGEQCLPLLFTCLTILFILNLYHQRFAKVRQIISHGIFALVIFLSHIKLLSLLPTNFFPSQRRFYFFTQHSFFEMKSIILPWFKEQVLPTYYQILSIFSSDYAQMNIPNQSTTTTFSIIILVLISVLFFFFTNKTKKQKNIIFTGLLILFLSFISFFIYAYLILMSGGGGYYPRYTFFTGSSILIVFIVFFYTVFNLRIARFCSFILITYLVLLFTTTNIGLKPTVFNLSKQIENTLLEGKIQGKKAILISHRLLYPPRAQKYLWWGNSPSNSHGIVDGLINMYYTGIQDQYKYFYSLERVVTDFFGYEMVSFQNFIENTDSVELISYYGNKKTYLKDDILILGNDTLNYNYSDPYKQQIISFYKWKDFQNSPLYNPIIIFTNNPKSYQKFYSMPHDYIFAIDIGETNNNHISNVLLDGKYGLKYNKISYGYLGNSNNINQAKNINNSSYLATNRFGNFTYRIDHLPQKPYWIALDFLEMWQSIPKQRIFTINIKTRYSSFTISPIDLVELDPSNGPISIVFGTTTTDFIEISTCTPSDSKDVPFISGLRLYDHF